MAAGVLLDTSYLITLTGASRAHHETARRYWRHFTENQIPMFLSTIVVSEFCVKQEIDPQILRCAKCGQLPCVCRRNKVKVKLADGKERTIQHMMMTTFWHPDGTPMSAQ